MRRTWLMFGAVTVGFWSCFQPVDTARLDGGAGGGVATGGGSAGGATGGGSGGGATGGGGGATGGGNVGGGGALGGGFGGGGGGLGGGGGFGGGLEVDGGGAGGGGAACQFGSDETCNGNIYRQYAQGHCLANGTCVCNDGLVLDGAGHCDVAMCNPSTDPHCTCIATPQGYACSCSGGLFIDPATRHCDPTCVYDGTSTPTQQCNVDRTELGAFGVCISNGVPGDPGSCQCVGTAQQDTLTGRCTVDDQRPICLVTNPHGSPACHYEFRDGGSASASLGFCSTAPVSAGCECTKQSGNYQLLCNGLCQGTTPDGGIERQCPQTNCGFIDCSTGTSCVSPNSCQ